MSVCITAIISKAWRTEHGDSDFDHFVSGGVLHVEDVAAAVVHFTLGDDDGRRRGRGDNLGGRKQVRKPF